MNTVSAHCSSPLIHVVLAFISETMNTGIAQKVVEITALRYSLMLLVQLSNQYLYCKGSPDSAKWGSLGEVSNNTAVSVEITALCVGRALFHT